MKEDQGGRRRCPLQPGGHAGDLTAVPLGSPQRLLVWGQVGLQEGGLAGVGLGATVLAGARGAPRNVPYRRSVGGSRGTLQRRTGGRHPPEGCLSRAGGAGASKPGRGPAGAPAKEQSRTGQGLVLGEGCRGWGDRWSPMGEWGVGVSTEETATGFSSPHPWASTGHRPHEAGPQPLLAPGPGSPLAYTLLSPTRGPRGCRGTGTGTSEAPSRAPKPVSSPADGAGLAWVSRHPLLVPTPPGAWCIPTAPLLPVCARPRCRSGCSQCVGAPGVGVCAPGVRLGSLWRVAVGCRQCRVAGYSPSSLQGGSSAGTGGP